MINLVAVYGAGWDGRALVNPMSRAEAATRDTYAVVLLDGSRVRLEIRVAWADSYLAAVRYDDRGRQVAQHEFRPSADGGLALWTAATWDGPDDLVGDEYERRAAQRFATYYRSDGRLLIEERPNGEGGGLRTQTGFEAAPRLPRPGPGDWAGLLTLIGAGPAEVVESDTHDLPVVHDSAVPWQPPRSLQPGDVAGLFTEGAVRPVAGGRTTARIEVVAAGDLRLPSGRLVAADPGWLSDDQAPYLVTVAPGSYPVTISRAHLAGDEEHVRIAAARLTVADRPVARWELVLCDGQDPLDLREGYYYGVSVDAGLACFLDAEQREHYAAWFDDDLPDELLEFDQGGFAMLDGGELIAYSSGWGDGAYPTWIGRDQDGEVVCFVTDMRL
ncbi:hypothetical protein BJY16_004807 [Actinoplanes octamycinicus]|uniref:DUF4241 domain-containing protein n=1 Tax=Actinoplanes octamycinicus TaxID=135948 RepID=A0A7W7M8V1_9ACTN|nr:DUF4241 domain-containing protein [Actinoplanes octamycinicus]MBB4741348.1 hypothetical protein [Actinoplanes octamycinicus]GIE62852.1 hypothetical protein Aoc01nite_82540 [Actinoplanes octamycinicus]